MKEETEVKITVSQWMNILAEARRQHIRGKEKRKREGERKGRKDSTCTNNLEIEYLLKQRKIERIKKQNKGNHIQNKAHL